LKIGPGERKARHRRHRALASYAPPFNGAGGGNFGAVFFLASAEPYARGGKAMINKSLTIGNERPSPNGRSPDGGPSVLALPQPQL